MTCSFRIELMSPTVPNTEDPSTRPAIRVGSGSRCPTMRTPHSEFWMSVSESRFARIPLPMITTRRKNVGTAKSDWGFLVLVSRPNPGMKVTQCYSLPRKIFPIGPVGSALRKSIRAGILKSAIRSRQCDTISSAVQGSDDTMAQHTISSP